MVYNYLETKSVSVSVSVSKESKTLDLRQILIFIVPGRPTAHDKLPRKSQINQ
jgi:hypothetical protein